MRCKITYKAAIVSCQAKKRSNSYFDRGEIICAIATVSSCEPIVLDQIQCDRERQLQVDQTSAFHDVGIAIGILKRHRLFEDALHGGLALRNDANAVQIHDNKGAFV